jgi:hypothetical protein
MSKPRSPRTKTKAVETFNKSGTVTGRVSSRVPHLANAPRPDSVAHSGSLGPIVVVEAKPPDEYTPTKDMVNILFMLSTQMSVEGITEVNFDIEGNLNIDKVHRLSAKLSV